ncbi:hypothetical protein P12x_002408 [Tundrisphaera lichenicola]|uniref:hypothetical protein n=1 Tax=Tundrisphaera lichenicola TaxID=2029860 RepID=UPI003EBF2A18
MRRALPIALTLCVGLASGSSGQEPRQPKVAPGPNEPDWVVVLSKGFGLSMFGDLLNPVKDSPLATPGLFRKAGPGPVTYTPIIALGLETVNRGGWYKPGSDAAHLEKAELWSYQFKHTTGDFRDGKFSPPPMKEGSKTSFDPGDAPFGLWVSNDGLEQSDAYTQPKVVAALNKRLAGQPYKAMIYPFKDRDTGKVVPHSYLIGWEYSTNDDFQDVVCRVDNVQLVIEP